MKGNHARLARLVIVTALGGAALSTTSGVAQPMDADRLNEFGTRYTAAWCSQKPAAVAAFFEEAGSLKINQGPAAVGRAAIAEAARGFMTDFPDLVVKMDGVSLEGDGRAVYRWTLTGTNTGPGGTGKSVRISGYEEWTFGPEGLVADSKGHFDEVDYNRQLGKGTKAN
jgi:SnoaL-like polyketide cyclase